VQEGLLIERSGKPAIYAPIEPSEAIGNLLKGIEVETLRQLEEKRRIVRNLSAQLSQIYEKTRLDA
jgi:sugar-specific transcriptional regulator TrmB